MRRAKLFALLLALPLLGAICKSAPPPPAPIVLKFWGVLDEQDAYQTAITAFAKDHPNVSVEYRKFRVEEFDRELLEAFAEDRGPDIFMVPNARVNEYRTKIQPLPTALTLPFQFVQGTVKKEVVTEVRQVQGLTVPQFERLFVDQAREDAVFPLDFQKVDGTTATRQAIYGFPLAVDSLALFYNKDLLNAAGIAEPPAVWSPDFQQAVIKLTKRGAAGIFTQSGVALGTSRNLDRASDILSVIMMQNGTHMTDDRGRAVFERDEKAREAVLFYTDFANAGKEVYSWNASQPSALEAFAAGKIAMMFGYSYHIPLIKNRAPKLKLGIAALPQVFPAAPVNFSNYWIFTVARKSKHPNEAWGVLQTLIQPEGAQNYLAVTKRPSGIRALIASQKDNPDLGVFSTQTLTAKSWYRGRDARAAERALLDMIDAVGVGTQKIQDALKIATDKINQTVR